MWDQRFLALARFVSCWSKDPSTKVGAVIADGKKVMGLGYNGFAQGVKDDPERYANREMKYKLVVHAERNAILFSRKTEGCTLYTWPFGCCSECAALVIQAGIKRAVFPEMSEELKARWGDSFSLSIQQFNEAGVEICCLQ